MIDTSAETWQANAAARLLEARRRNGRLGARKSRGGCITCKVRKVKCDQARPACRKCTSFGRTCEGYTQPAQALLSDVTQLVAVSTSPFLALREQDKRSFEFYVTWGAPRLAGSLDKQFWTGDILQLAQQEPCILDSLLAISLLYEHPQYIEVLGPRAGARPISQPIGDGMKTPALATIGFEDGPPPLNQHHAAALRAYNRAIVQLRHKLEDGKASPLLALASCVLFLCIEVIRDNVFGALALFAKGNGLLDLVNGQSPTNREQTLVTTIRLMMHRLGVLAAAFGHPKPIEYTAQTELDSCDNSFGSTSDARDALFSIMATSHKFIARSIQYRDRVINGEKGELSTSGLWHTPSTVEQLNGRVTDSDDTEPRSGREVLVSLLDGVQGPMHCKSDGDKGPCHVCDSQPSSRRNTSIEALNAESALSTEFAQILDDLQEQQMKLASRLELWEHRSEHVFLSAQHDEPDVVSSLMHQYHVSFIWLSTRLAIDQMVFDDFTDHFERVLHYAEIYITSKVDERLNFTFEVGAVPSLYFTATKCRIPSIRRRALRLLARAPRKECMWGAASTGQIAARLITIEEEGMGLVPPAWDGSSLGGGPAIHTEDDRFPAEEMRVHNLELIQIKRTRMHELRVTRYRLVDGKRYKVVQDYPV
ncbi:hypothetical protein LTR62_002703 [Meristemomyces frigidus]|uniref:Zn(2)-C6 fungal-type domain-containing protein n=1 Tax=Meristemomyces frigidus TaxID=1508187 RepID=A0AAN7YL21_9PEZI|nr:hypothetical protein LTR62_002703 [Meristemomyces frigidus]